MNELAIKRALNDSTRKQDVLVGKDLYALHITKNREVIVTERSDYSRVYAVLSLDLYNTLIKTRQIKILGADFKEWVDRRLDTDEPEPFCPFLGLSAVGYCNMAYSEPCYTCEESSGEWERKKRDELEN